MNVMNVLKPFHVPVISNVIKRRQIGEKTHEHNQCGKAFPTPSHLQYHKKNLYWRETL